LKPERERTTRTTDSRHNEAAATTVTTAATTAATTATTSEFFQPSFTGCSTSGRSHRKRTLNPDGQERIPRTPGKRANASFGKFSKS